MEELSLKSPSEKYEEYLQSARKLANPQYSFDTLFEHTSNLYVRYEAEQKLLEKYKDAEINTKELHRALRKYDKKQGKRDAVQHSRIGDVSRILVSQYIVADRDQMGEALYTATVLAHKLLARERNLKTLLGELKSIKRRCENFVRDGME